MVALALKLSVMPALAEELVTGQLFEKADEFLWGVDGELAKPLKAEPTKAGRDWVGLGRDTAFAVGYEVALTGILYLMPESVTSWSDEQKDAGPSKWWDNVRDPEWDEDKWWINYIFHPYFGAVYYIRARERGFDRFSSFLYSGLLSAAYEFGVEAFFERPSIQDLIFTPVGGFLVGAFIFEPIRAPIKAKAELKWHDHLVLILTDPLGAANYVMERLFGIKSDIRVDIRPSSLVQHYQPAGRGGGPPEPQESLQHDRGVNIGLRLRWD